MLTINWLITSFVNFLEISVSWRKFALACGTNFSIYIHTRNLFNLLLLLVCQGWRYNGNQIFKSLSIYEVLIDCKKKYVYYITILKPSSTHCWSFKVIVDWYKWITINVWWAEANGKQSIRWFFWIQPGYRAICHENPLLLLMRSCVHLSHVYDKCSNIKLTEWNIKQNEWTQFYCLINNMYTVRRVT